MYGVLLGFHILISVALVGIVLMQSGKGGGLAGGAFGGGAQTVFGGRGANDMVTRATIVLGGLFFVTSLVLALMTSSLGHAPRSLIQEQAKEAATQPAPAPAPASNALPGQTPAGSPSATPATPAVPPSGNPAGNGQGGGGAGGK